MMRVSYGLPTHMVDHGQEFVTAEAVAELAATAERAGLDAVYVTEHPFPPGEWVEAGGHHALDPLVTLAVAAAATSHLRLHTNLLVAPYRNPFLAAKAVSTLDVLSGGRVTLGIGAGYLEGEFEALGAPFERRNQVVDEALAAMRAAWTGRPVSLAGEDFTAAGNVMLPRPVQDPHPPLWIGGNSRRAARRAIDLADGWSPFPLPARGAAGVRTAALPSVEALAGRLDELADYARARGRAGPFDVVFAAPGTTMSPYRSALDPDVVVAGCAELAAIGVTWVTVALPGATRAAQVEAVAHFREHVLPHLHALEPRALLPDRGGEP